MIDTLHPEASIFLLRGALRREQPWTETAEIALYVAVTGVDGWILARP